MSFPLTFSKLPYFFEKFLCTSGERENHLKSSWEQTENPIQQGCYWPEIIGYPPWDRCTLRSANCIVLSQHNDAINLHHQHGMFVGTHPFSKISIPLKTSTHSTASLTYNCAEMWFLVDLQPLVTMIFEKEMFSAWGGEKGKWLSLEHFYIFLACSAFLHSVILVWTCFFPFFPHACFQALM